MIDVDGYVTRWFDHFLKGEDNGVDNDPPVYVFEWARTSGTPRRTGPCRGPSGPTITGSTPVLVGGVTVRGDRGYGGEGVQDPATPGGERSEPRGRRDGSRRGVQRLGDELEERLAGPLDVLGGLQVGRGVHRGVESLECDARLQETIGPRAAI